MVTKVPIMLDEDDVRKIFQKILDLIYKNRENTDHKKLLKLIVDKKIPIFLVKIPKLN